MLIRNQCAEYIVAKAGLYVEQNELCQVGEGDITLDTEFTLKKGNTEQKMGILPAVAFVMSSKGGRASGPAKVQQQLNTQALATSRQLAILEEDFKGANYYAPLTAERLELLLKKLNNHEDPVLSADQVRRWFRARRDTSREKVNKQLLYSAPIRPASQRSSSRLGL